jgi:hypothetical protein
MLTGRRPFEADNHATLIQQALGAGAGAAA